MKKISQIFIFCNWKTYFLSTKNAISMIDKIKTQKNKVVIGIAPTSLHIESIKNKLKRKSMLCGAQYISENTGGANTGETTKEQIKKEKIDFVIVGHNERRKMGDNINKQIKNTVSVKIMPILCIGESKGESAQTTLKKQLKEALKGVSTKDCSGVVFAYEPVKFIGKKNPMKTIEINSRMKTIKKILKDNYKITNPVVLYGGSVNETNAVDILQNGNCNGLLIGRASTNPVAFNKILKCISINK